MSEFHEDEEAQRQHDAAMADLQHCVEQKTWYRRRPKHIKDVVSDLMSRRGYAQQSSVDACQDAWYASVDERMAKHTRPGKLRRGVLEIQVRNSAVMQELTFDKPRLLARLKEELPHHSISDLRFRVGQI